MCFSFRASVAAGVTGVVSAIFILYFLYDRVVDTAVGRVGAILPALLVTPSIVQACDAAAHVQVAGGAAHSSWVVALVAYLAIASQPVILSAAVGLLLGGAWLLLLAANTCLVVLSVTTNLVGDVPVGDWLRLEIVARDDAPSNVVHGFFAYGGTSGLLIGPASRAIVYFATLGLAFVGLIVLAVDIDGRDDPYARPVLVYTIGLGATLWALYLASEVFVNYVSRVRHHVSSVWCAVSLVGTTAFGLYLTTARSADRGYGALFVVGTLGTYVSTYALAGSPIVHGQSLQLVRKPIA